jgi:hypothetical protein
LGSVYRKREILILKQQDRKFLELLSRLEKYLKISKMA